ncbi:hypothetical protein ABNF97_27490 [Plantactinospora sp. B6F1]|uniref:hypothetical protein n=1 Tax=Plantactinospora sp. B6F1 TaxID=3158971 RepID=UPI0032D95846
MLLTLPQSDAAELTAARTLWPFRAMLVAGLMLAILSGVAAVCLILESWWFFLPVTRGAIFCASTTFAVSTILPMRYVAAAPLLYLLICYFSKHGEVWWDVVLAHPSAANLTVGMLIAVAGGSLFSRAGARGLEPHEEYG